jgi:hypothetical protein
MKRGTLRWLTGLAIAAPLLLWADVWLAFQFGFWLDALVGGSEGAAGMLGVFAFGALVAAEGIAAWLITLTQTAGEK